MLDCLYSRYNESFKDNLYHGQQNYAACYEVCGFVDNLVILKDALRVLSWTMTGLMVTSSSPILPASMTT